MFLRVIGVPLATFQGHRGEVDTLVFSPDGTQFVSGGGDGMLRLWKIAPLLSLCCPFLLFFQLNL
jgi:WD40 repeat protein